MLSGQNATLCGGPETTVHRTASPTLIVRFAGSNRLPVASPIILTSHVFPVAGWGTAGVGVVRRREGTADAVAPALGFSPRPHATVEAARISNNERMFMMASLGRSFETKRVRRASSGPRSALEPVGRVLQSPRGCAKSANMKQTEKSDDDESHRCCA